MSVTIKWVSEGTTGSDSVNLRTHVRTAYLVSTSALNSVDALQAAGIPEYGDAHPAASALKVKTKNATNLGNGFEWIIRVEYVFETPPPKEQQPPKPTSPTVPDDDPTTEPWEFSQDYQEIQIVQTAMAETSAPGGNSVGDADPNLNTAGESFATPLAEPVYCNILILEKSLASDAMSIGAAEAFQGSVNTAQITVAGVSIAVRQGFMRRCSVQRRYYGEDYIPYWRLRVEIVVYPADIRTDFAVLQTGYNEIKNGVVTAIFAKDGSPTRVPQLLDANGAAIDPTSGTRLYRYFMRSKRANWSGLGLPSSI